MIVSADDDSAEKEVSEAGKQNNEELSSQLPCLSHDLDLLVSVVMILVNEEDGVPTTSSHMYSLWETSLWKTIWD
eukprot:15278072-Ditylum_brightwellii.AAC.1